jgi:hypothetical protein
MAIWYTDYLTGNDTTGDGSIALPYKTINKAMTVGTNGDEIRVAGSGFTALAGTVTAASSTATTWNTSSNLTGILLPGDIITVNDAEHGDQKFFYKVQTITSTQITVDGAWNRPSTQNLTFSKLTTQHYFTTSTNITFENVTITGKDDFKITGGWTDSYTAQNGWTVMAYHSTSSATAKSGTGFTAVTGGANGALYFDKFMLSHLNVGFAGSTSRWYQGTLAFVYFTTTSPYGAGVTTNHPYGSVDLYLTNSPITTAIGGSYTTNNIPQMIYENVWYTNTASPTTTSVVAIEINNLYTRSSFSTGIQIYGTIPGVNTFVQNLTIATQQNAGSTENILLFSNSASVLGSSGSVENDILIVGDNTTGFRIGFAAGSNPNSMINQITLPTKSVEDFGTGINTGLVGQGGIFSGLKPNTLIKDIEGEKQVFSNGGVAFADPTVFDTGSNSLRVSKIDNANSLPTNIPIKSYWNDTADAKTITIRAKASGATDVQFSLLAYRLQLGTSNSALLSTLLLPETKSLTTSWADYTYTGVNATYAEILLNSYFAIGVRIDNLSAKYVWIDSVTIS